MSSNVPVLPVEEYTAVKVATFTAVCRFIGVAGCWSKAVLRIYRSVRPDEPLSQGDIFRNVPLPDVSFKDPYELVAGSEEAGILRERQLEGDFRAGMHFVATIYVVDAVVLDQSCEAIGADRILLAPLIECKLDGKGPKDRYDYVKRLGNSLYEPSRIYLAQEPDLAFPKWIIDLGGKFHLLREDMEHFIQTGKRKATLSLKNLLYLQSRLTVYFGRDARDDIDWLERDDIQTKIDVLTAEVKKKKDGLKSKEGDLAKANTEYDRQKLEDDISARNSVLHDIEVELIASTSALAELERREKPETPDQAGLLDDADSVGKPHLAASGEAAERTSAATVQDTSAVATQTAQQDVGASETKSSGHGQPPEITSMSDSV